MDDNVIIFFKLILGWVILFIYSYITTPLTKKMESKNSKDFLIVFSNNISLIHAIVMIFLTSKLNLDESTNENNSIYVNNIILVL